MRCGNAGRPQSAMLTVDGRQYRLIRRGRRWIVSVRCDCLLGPHWHDTGVSGLSIIETTDAIRGE